MDENSQILTFLDFELLIDQRLLKRTDSEQTVRLSNSESLLLQFLAQTPGETVSRETLLSECWPGRIVTQSSLNVAIKNLRQAFEQLNSESPIVTDLGKGYSLRGNHGLAKTKSSQKVPFQLTTRLIESPHCPNPCHGNG
ncbi:hypothetical protein B6A42_06155 [Vibrio coralliilyticus]|nr:hypothetical protein B6A42_06155 [Vibrio coralliilyticus]